MISYERFRQEVMNRILSYLPESYGDWKVRMETEYKVNQTLDCLTLFPPEQRKLIAVPKFYMQEYYKMFLKGASADYILRMIASRIENAPSPEAVEASGFDLLQFQNDVVLQLVNRFRNHVFLKSVPHRPFLDLAVIYRILVFDPNGVWSGAIVNYSMLNAMGITEEELFERAYKHTPQALPFRLADTGEILMVTNDSEQFGAAAMLYPEQLNAACEKLGGSIYIFPGSMHELYIVREEPAKLDFYRQMVACANSDVVDETEWLSGQVYRYNQKTGKVRVAT
ncbi:MAG: DUF5688 family protein [Anaerovoracaceae bacterium]|nr:DUF5688 family protein [Anaerovoracaceae bacterium]